MFAKLYEIPSLPFQDIEKTTSRTEKQTDEHQDEWMDGWMVNVKTVYPPQTQFAGG